jgi:hypothetical protein
LQETQAPLQATLQQTPSAQKFEAHSTFISHFAPLGFLPQLSLWHCRPLTHWPFVEHLVKHFPVELSHE